MALSNMHNPTLKRDCGKARSPLVPRLGLNITFTFGGVDMFLRNTAALLICVGALAACAAFETSEATHILSGQSYPPSDAASVAIYIEKPSFNYTVVGIVEARGMAFITGGEKRDQELAIQALKQEAASIGADGVIISDSNQVIASVSKDGTSTERRIKGLAIRRQ